MKVFEIFYYNLNQIRFKQNKCFIDDALEEHGFEYTDISFIFKDDIEGEICKKTVKLFPELEEYLFHYAELELYKYSDEYRGLSSVFLKDDGTLNYSIKREHHRQFGELLKKIPHSVNFPFIGVMLDRVNWYKDNSPNDVLLNKENEYIIINHQFVHYLSNSVRFYKEFDYGNKRNYIGLMIDRTKDSDSLREYPERFEEFLDFLGKPYSKELVCGFDNAERKALEDAKQTIKEWKTKIDYSYKFAEFKKDEHNLSDAMTPISGYSPKSILNKIAKINGYNYIGFANSCYTYKRTNENNHVFIVEFSVIPFSLYVDASISVNGYNFMHFIYTDRNMSIKDKGVLESYAQKAFETAKQLENDISELLYTLYGKTPDWFI